jgi:restriction system protein
MAIPTFEQMLRPILALACEGTITRVAVTAAMEDHFKLNPEERNARIQTGATYVRNRAGWAMTFLTKGGLIEKVAPRTYQATEFGRKFLADHPTEISNRDLKRIPGWEQAWQVSKASKEDQATPESDETTTPLEALDQAITTLNRDLKKRLLDAIMEQTPAFFEQLVLDVLVAMGYGGSREDAALHLGKSNDEGIDGAIKQDPLGLDLIVVQAKRYKPENIIDRQTIQAFIGSMAGQGVTKGIFITTSGFNANAKEFVLRGAQAKVILIDGETLLGLMLRHRIGVRVERAFELLDLDQNYFNEED